MSPEADSKDRTFLMAAEKVAANLQGDAQAEITSIIATRYAKLELVHHAIELAETIFDPFTRDNTFAEIAAASIATGTSDYADALLEMIDDPAVRSVAIEQIDDPFQFAHASTKEAIEYFRAGQIGEALTLLSEALELVLDEPVYSEQGMLMKDSLLAELAVGFVIVGHLEKSLQVTEKLGSVVICGIFLRLCERLCVLCVKSPIFHAKHAKISRAAERSFFRLRHYQKLSSEAERYMALEQVGKECARTGNSRGIFQAAESITNDYSTTSYWLAMTDVLRESAATDLARQTLFEAAKSATLIQDNYEKAMSLIEAAYRFALINSAKASELFIQALVMINQLEEDNKKAPLLLRIDERFRELNRKPNEEERLLLGRVWS